MARAVTALFNTPDYARAALRQLRAAGFPADQIGVILPEGTVSDDSDTAQGMNHALQGSVAGGVVGGSLGALLVATGALAVPGIGPFITGGILATLVGGAAGWLVGTLAGMGVPEDDARYLEEQVHSGRALITVHTDDRGREAAWILHEHGGELDRRSVEELGMTADKSAQNASQRDGQFRDMMHSKSDDGTVPPTVQREAVTAPPSDLESLHEGVQGDEAKQPSRRDEAGAFVTPKGAVGDSNPVPLSPSDPHRHSSEGQPFLDDANPYGRDLENRQERPMGGVGVMPKSADPERQRAREQPGEDSANPLPQALKPEPFADPDKQP